MYDWNLVYKANNKWNFDDNVLSDAIIIYLENVDKGKYTIETHEPLKLIYGMCLHIKRNTNKKLINANNNNDKYKLLLKTINKTDVFDINIFSKEELELLHNIRYSQLEQFIINKFADKSNYLIIFVNYVFSACTYGELAIHLGKSKTHIFEIMKEIFEVLQNEFIKDYDIILKKEICKIKKFYRRNYKLYGNTN